MIVGNKSRAFNSEKETRWLVDKEEILKAIIILLNNEIK